MTVSIDTTFSFENVDWDTTDIANGSDVIRRSRNDWQAVWIHAKEAKDVWFHALATKTDQTDQPSKIADVARVFVVAQRYFVAAQALKDAVEIVEDVKNSGDVVAMYLQTSAMIGTFRALVTAQAAYMRATEAVN